MPTFSLTDLINVIEWVKKLKRPRCDSCGVKIPEGMVPKYVKAANGTWIKVDKRCYKLLMNTMKPTKPGMSP